MKNKTVILIAGPTAVGKTSVAVELAQSLRTKIISADSRQCFKELNIGVAKPSQEQLQSVQHYFISSHSVHDDVNAGMYEELALQYADEIFREHDAVVMVGGTGLYIKAFCEGLDNMPQIDLETRNKIQEEYSQKGLEWLQNEVKKDDPEFYKAGEIENPQRMMRALEVVRITGRSILSFRKQQKKERPFRIIKIALELPKEKLYHNINTRVDQMMDDGLLDEIKGLQHLRSLNALQTVGYSELFDYLDGKISLEEAIDDIKKNTRHYAKRQMTWFRKDQEFTWVHPKEIFTRIDFFKIGNNG
ncbi:MAG: tRNA (adenosine(37)-N6)-dimethylallyltransferase MiaA [Bacteroidetes bacterium]|nr:tRNA (adenosine(37)-N6)-dimethylallyltransferase MiaA [Bacteroidota bacterium]